MVMQAWGAYGVLWPVVHQWLGVSPDLGRDRVSVVPQVPANEDSIFGSKIRLGGSSIDVRATHRGSSYATIVDRRSPVALTIGMVLPKNARIQIIALNGEPVTPQLVQTSPGPGGPGQGAGGHRPDAAGHPDGQDLMRPEPFDRLRTGPVEGSAGEVVVVPADPGDVAVG